MLCSFSTFKNVWPLSETSDILSFFFFFFFLLPWVFLAVYGVFFLVAASRGYSLDVVHGLLFAVALRKKLLYF